MAIMNAAKAKKLTEANKDGRIMDSARWAAGQNFVKGSIELRVKKGENSEQVIYKKALDYFTHGGRQELEDLGYEVEAVEEDTIIKSFKIRW